MSVVENTTIAGNVSTDGTPINVVFPATSQIEITNTTDSIALGTSTELLTATDVGPKVALDVNVAASVLPTGAATATLQTTANASLVSINSKLTSPVTITGTTLDLILDDTSTANVTYIGQAVIGSATSAAVWQIKKLNETSGLVLTWAGSTSAFNQVWNDRTGLTYG